MFTKERVLLALYVLVGLGLAFAVRVYCPSVWMPWFNCVGFAVLFGCLVQALVRSVPEHVGVWGVTTRQAWVSRPTWKGFCQSVALVWKVNLRDAWVTFAGLCAGIMVFVVFFGVVLSITPRHEDVVSFGLMMFAFAVGIIAVAPIVATLASIPNLVGDQETRKVFLKETRAREIPLPVRKVWYQVHHLFHSRKVSHR